MNIDFLQCKRSKKIRIPEINSELAEDIGLQIGDGSIGHWKSGVFTRHIVDVCGDINEDRLYLTNFVKPLKEKLYEVYVAKIDNVNANTFVLRIYSKNLLSFYEHLGLPVGPKIKLSIPDFILEDKKLEIGCLRGLFDTDGSLGFSKGDHRNHNNPVIHFSSKSEHLVKQVCDILNDLSIPYSVCMNVKRYDKRYKKIYIGNHIYISGKKNLDLWMKMIGFHNDSKIERYLIYKKFGFCPPRTTHKQRVKILKEKYGGNGVSFRKAEAF